jgi:hypothetical protein
MTPSSDRPSPPAPQNDGAQWDRVAAELRAYREAQQRAWGTIDNATLGRYLAGEVNGDERRQVETALQELPELRKLTDLVRDVLEDFEPIATVPSPSISAPAPVILSLSEHRSSRRSSRSGLLEKAGSRLGFLRQRSALVAAACLLLALGLFLPRSGLLSSVAEPRTGPALASRPIDPRSSFIPEGSWPLEGVSNEPPEFEQLVRLETGDREALGLADATTARSERRLAQQLQRVDESVEMLKKQGKDQEAAARARTLVVTLDRQARAYQKEGDLGRAEPVLYQAHNICQNALGPGDPETVRLNHSLARLYLSAINSADLGEAPTFVTSAKMTERDMPREAPPVSSVTFSPDGRHTATALAPPAAPAAAPLAPCADPTDGKPEGQRLMGSAPRMPMGRPPMAGHPHGGHQPRGYVGKKGTGWSASLAALGDRLAGQGVGEVRSSVVPVLVQALTSTDSPEERKTLALALGRLGPAAADAAPALAECLCHKARSPVERQAIVFALGQLGPAARRAVAVLAPESRPECKNEKKEAPPDPQVRALLRRLQGRDGRIGVKDEGACFSVRALNVAQREIRFLAHHCNVEVLVETVPALDGGTAERVAACCRELGPRGVHGLIARRDGAVRVHIAEALSKEGFRAADLRRLLQDHFREQDYDGGLVEGMQLLARFEKAESNK